MMKLKLYTVLFVMVSLFLSNCGDDVDEESREEFTKTTGFDPNGTAEIVLSVFYPATNSGADLNPYANNTPQTIPFNVSRSVLTIREYLDYDNDKTKLGPEKTIPFVYDFSLNGPNFTGDFDNAIPFHQNVEPVVTSYQYSLGIPCNQATDKSKFQLKARLYDSANNEIGAGTGFVAPIALLECPSTWPYRTHLYMQLFKK